VQSAWAALNLRPHRCARDSDPNQRPVCAKEPTDGSCLATVSCERPQVRRMRRRGSWKRSYRTPTSIAEVFLPATLGRSMCSRMGTKQVIGSSGWTRTCWRGARECPRGLI